MQGSTSFWARRKAAVQAEAAVEAAEAQARLAANDAEALAASQAEKTDSELLVELGLPDPDSLALGDDFSGFMARAVPEHLRRRALRKLWVSNPVLANLDGLLDHGEDYTDAATVIPGMQTAYQVGKGMMSHVIALAEQQAAKEKALAAPEPALLVSDNDAVMQAPESEPVAEQVAAPEADVQATETLASKSPATEIQTFDAPPPRRHMRFDFAS
ncbi:DUF3306 domain-containing protein [Pseudorhodobacter ferrugineus]|uniref:DUF3306 domain-containing protein n=1 Tax=Pseudorhodobacter ferrugineus TaxID=77008 RepID=UPI0003B3D6E5|nr:DUF3306 domain-containing protein [Pseudorhodobacter ferrugineus]